MRNRIAPMVVLISGMVVLWNGQVAAQGVGGGGQAPAPAPLDISFVEGSGTPGTIPLWTGTALLGDSHIQDTGSALTLAEPISGAVMVNGPVSAMDTSGDSAVLAGGSGLGIGGTGTTIGVQGQGNTGVQGLGTTVGVVGTGTGTFGIGVQGNGPAMGLLGNSNGGTGVQGNSVNQVGVLGTTQSLNSSGVLGVVDSPAPNGASGVYGDCPGTQGVCNGVLGVTNAVGTGVRGVYNGPSSLASGQFGFGVWGTANPAAGTSHGVIGDTYSSDGVGVIGAGKSTTGATEGIRGDSASPQGIGVHGENFAGGLAGQFDGNVLINGDLTVTGNAYKPGGGSWSNSSDLRLKKSVLPIKGGLHQLLQLRGVTYEYTNPSAIGELPGTHIGMVAQEVAQVFPSWVDAGKDGYKRLTFRGFEAVTVEAVRELDANAKEATARIADLEQQNAELRHAIDALSEAVKMLQQK